MAPRTKFSFKTKKNSAPSSTDAADIAGRKHIPGYHFPDVSSRESSINLTPNYALAPMNESEQLQPSPEAALTSSAALLDNGKEAAGLIEETSMRRPTFSNTFSVAGSSHHGLYLMLPTSASRSTVPASITSLRRCVVSIPTVKGQPYASLTINGVKESLLICGQVEGPAHITDVEHSAVVVACRQFRMHNCADVVVYLSCRSHPIIEDCKGVRFGRLPKAYVSRFCSLFLSVYTEHCSRLRNTNSPITGIKLRTSNGLNPSPVRIGVF